MKKLLLLLVACATLTLVSCSTDSMTGPTESSDIVNNSELNDFSGGENLPPLLPPPQKDKVDIHDPNMSVTAEQK